MQITGAVIKEQGVTFAVVVVRPHIINNPVEANAVSAGWAPVFGMPIVLMAQDYSGRPTYYGRRDIADFMSNVPLRNIPWKTYNIN